LRAEWHARTSAPIRLAVYGSNALVCVRGCSWAPSDPPGTRTHRHTQAHTGTYRHTQAQTSAPGSYGPSVASETQKRHRRQLRGRGEGAGGRERATGRRRERKMKRREAGPECAGSTRRHLPLLTSQMRT